MKKLIMGLVLVLGVSLFARDAQIYDVRPGAARGPAFKSALWTPFSLNLVTPVGLPWGYEWDVYGLQIGLWNDVSSFEGWQIGLVNITQNFRGLQVGIVNYTYKMYGMQIGVANVIEDNDIPFLPILNCYF